MAMLQIKIEKLQSQCLDQDLDVRYTAISNRYIAPLRDLDAIKFRNFIELHISVNEGETFSFFERKTIDPQAQPMVSIFSQIQKLHILDLNSKFHLGITFT